MLTIFTLILTPVAVAGVVAAPVIVFVMAATTTTTKFDVDSIFFLGDKRQAPMTHAVTSLPGALTPPAATTDDFLKHELEPHLLQRIRGVLIPWGAPGHVPHAPVHTERLVRPALPTPATSTHTSGSCEPA